jgi:hypothetical protein
MLRRIRYKPLLALDRAADFLWRHGTLFHDSMSHNRRNRTVEEIENPVMDALQTRTKFVNSLPQPIRLRAAQLVTVCSRSRSTRRRHFACAFTGSRSIHSRNGHEPSSSQ